MAQNQPDPKAPEKPRVIPELRLDRMGLVEHKHRQWFVFIPHGTEFKDLETEHYWANLSHLLRKYDTIRCVWEDTSREVTVTVLGAGQGWAKVVPIPASKVEYPKFDVAKLNTILPGHKVRYTNDFQKWVVEREADQRVLKDQCDTEEQAFRWLDSYAKSLKA